MSENMRSKILAEQVEKRTRNGKFFRTEKHGGIAAIYPHPIHYEEDGQWKEIDNTLEDDEEVNGYKNKDSRMKVKFAKSSSAKKLVSIQMGEHKLSWGVENNSIMDGINETSEEEMVAVSDLEESVEIQKNEFVVYQTVSPLTAASLEEEKEVHNRRMMNVNKNKSGGIYQNIRPGAHLEYRLIGESLKENIILDYAEAGKNPFIFHIHYEKLNPVRMETGEIVFVDKEHSEEVFRLEVPYMSDSNGSFSNQVEYKMESLSENEMLLYIVPDQQWLMEEERVFPVVIDPNVETSRAVKNIEDSFVREKYPDNSGVGLNGSFYVANNSGYGICRSLLRFHELPEIPEGSVIYDARLCIWQYKYSSYGTEGFYVSAHEVTGDWTRAEVTWNNQPGYNTEVLDYAKMDQVQSGNTITITPKQFNITKLVRKWYMSTDSAKTNLGILLKMMDESIRAEAVFVSSDHTLDETFTSDLYPSGEFYYRDTKGLEDYYSYHEQNVGRAGHGYVNDFNGNLVLVHPDMVTSGNRFPISLSHVYNLSRRNERKRLGSGWRLSAYQELKATENEDFPYVYTDGDGTDHHFYKDTKDNNKLKDEDGLGLLITQTESTEDTTYRIMETKDKVQKIFHKDGRLMKEIDPNGNTIQYDYESDQVGMRLCKVTDSSGQKISLGYYDGGKLKTMELIGADETAKRVITYEYENTEDLKQITYPDGKKTRYGYDGTNHELMYVKAPDGYEMDYTYLTDCNVRRVAAIKEKNGDAEGYEMRISYENGNVTIFEEPGLDGNIENTADNRVFTYQFDNNGRPVCVCDQDGNGAVYSYFKDGQQNNKISCQGQTIKTVINYLKNIRLEENLTNWTIIGDAAKVGVASEMGYIGDKSLKVAEIGQETAGVYQEIPLDAGTYTASAYMNVKNIEEGGKVELVVEGIKSDNSRVELARSVGITEKTDEQMEQGWQREVVTFTMDSEYSSIRLSAAASGGVKEGYMTCFQLENGIHANRLNLMENGSFECLKENTTAVPETFLGNLTNDSEWADGRIYGTSKTGMYSLRIYGEPAKRKCFWKSIPVKGTEKDVYLVSGWAKGKGVPGREFGMTVGFKYEDDTVKWEEIKFNPYVSDWQFAAGVITPADKNSDTDKKYKEIIFHCFYGENANDAYFDGLQLMRDDAGSYLYDDEGNLVSAKTAAEQSSFSYDTDGKIAKMMDIKGNSFEYGYDSKQNLTRASSTENIIYQFEYDEKGNPIRTLAYGEPRKGVIVPGKSYYIREKISGKYLDVPNGTTTELTEVHLYEFTGSNSQKWKVTDAASGYFYLVPQHGENLALGVADGADNDGVKVQIQKKENKDAQKFRFVQKEKGEYQITAKAANCRRCLTNAADSTANGAGITTWAANDTYDRQKWYLEPADEATLSDDPKDGGIFAIRARHSGQYLDVQSGGTAAGTPLTQYYYNGRDWQSFLLKKAETEGDFYIHPLNAPELVLARVGEYETRNTITLQEFNQGTESQKFRFEKVGNAYAIVNPASNEGFGIMGNSYESGARVVTNGGALSTYAPNKLFLLEERGIRMESASEYTEDGRHISKVTDTRGNSITYTYDADNRMLTKVTDARGNETKYTYDADNDHLLKVSSEVGDAASVCSYTYDEGDRLTGISHNGFSYGFEYDSFGNRIRTKVGNTTLASYEYLPNSSVLRALNYGNGDCIVNTYDKNLRLLSQIHKNAAGNEQVLYENEYDASNHLVCRKDMINDLIYQYQYDLIGRLTGMDCSNGQSLKVIYDDKNRTSIITHKVLGETVKTQYLYGEEENKEYPGLLYGIKVDDVRKSTIAYDRLGRPMERKLHIDDDTEYVTSYTYAAGKKSWQTTALPESITNGNKTISYTYDENGNILTISENGSLKVTYHYDELNQLIREDNLWECATFVYEYDTGGNILSRKEYDYTTGYVTLEPLKTFSYTYGNGEWKDLLTEYDQMQITYDAIGNPLRYKGMQMEWEKGRQLKTLTKGDVTYHYFYDENGIRIGKKTMQGDEQKGSVTYHVNGKEILAMEKDGKTAHFIYDQDGKLFAMRCDGKEYYYLHNIQDDVIGLIDSSGNQVVSYQYNSWGVLLGQTDSSGEGIGELNPFRYRGYCYDAETGFYYLGRRYYDPEIGRFLNEDTADVLMASPTSLTNKNLYAYCDNNPVMRTDSTGALWIEFGIIAAGGVVGAVMGSFTAAATGGNILESFIEGGLNGLVGTSCGLLMSNPLGAIVVAAVGGGVVDFGTQVTSQYIRNDSVDISKIDLYRIAKTALFTGAGAAIKSFPGWEENAIDAFATAFTWGECSVLIACADVIGTNIYNNSKAKTVNRSTSRKISSSKKITCRVTTTTADYFRQRYNSI